MSVFCLFPEEHPYKQHEGKLLKNSSVKQTRALSLFYQIFTWFKYQNHSIKKRLVIILAGFYT